MKMASLGQCFVRLDFPFYKMAAVEAPEQPYTADENLGLDWRLESCHNCARKARLVDLGVRGDLYRWAKEGQALDGNCQGLSCRLLSA